MWETIRWDEPGPAVARVTLDRPDRLNAYTSTMCRELREALDRYDRDDSAHALILTGNGRGFCSGGDIAGDDPAVQRELDGQLGRAQNLKHDLHAVIRDLVALDKIVIAAVNGVAVAGGLTLAAAADYRLAARSARLGDTSGRVGLIPDEGGAWLFPRLMGYPAALRMAGLSEVYDAETARALGLVSEVVDDADLEAAALELATQFARRSPVALRVTKRLMRDGQTASLDQSLSQAALAVMFVNTGEDAREGLAAFRERRPPHYPGR